MRQAAQTVSIALFVALSMATFAVLFGTRHIDATEHQHGLMLAIAAESLVKLLAFLAVFALIARDRPVRFAWFVIVAGLLIGMLISIVLSHAYLYLRYL